MIKAVLFDLWNTLAYIPGLTRMMEKEKQLLGEERYQKVRSLFIAAHDHPVSINGFIDEVTQAIAATSKELDCIRESYDIPTALLFDDVIPTFKLIKELGLSIGIISNTTMPPIVRHLARLGLN